MSRFDHLRHYTAPGQSRVSMSTPRDKGGRAEEPSRKNSGLGPTRERDPGLDPEHESSMLDVSPEPTRMCPPQRHGAQGAQTVKMRDKGNGRMVLELKICIYVLERMEKSEITV